MYVAILTCLLGVAATVFGVETAVHKTTTNLDADKATDILQSIISQAETKRKEPEDSDIESLVSPGRALRNSYVRFGRSSMDQDVEDDYEDDQLETADKRSKHYVRFGRDGRHYVRFGRSSLGTLSSDLDLEDEDDGLVTKRGGEKHYVRFGRSADANDAESKIRRLQSQGKYFIRYGRANGASRLVRTDRQPANKHYVRFGRSRNADALIDDNVDIEDLSTGLRPLIGDDKRSNTKHYVRFGRSQPAIENGSNDIDVGGDDREVSKRSKHYVRFGRSGQPEDQKRANYVRFG